MFLDAVDQHFKQGKKKKEGGKPKEYLNEDLVFAKGGLQPSTVG